MSAYISAGCATYGDLLALIEAATAHGVDPSTPLLTKDDDGEIVGGGVRILLPVEIRKTRVAAAAPPTRRVSSMTARRKRGR